MLAVLPWADVAVPPGVEVLLATAEGAADIGVDDAVFYALPLTFAAAPLELMSRLPALNVVQTLTAGYEHVLPFLPEGVTLCAGGDIHGTSVAEFAVALILAAQRGLPEFTRAQAAGRWAHVARPSLADRSVVVIGRGSIGWALARRLTAFECAVTLVGRTAGPDSIGVDALPDVLASADVVVLAVPLTPATNHLVDAGFLARLPDGALLVNVARGSVVDTQALVTELASGRLRAALDVTDPEPLPAGHALWTTPNTVITPHVAGNSSAFVPRAKRLLAEQLSRLVQGRPLLHVITIPRSEEAAS